MEERRSGKSARAAWGAYEGGNECARELVRFGPFSTFFL